MMRINRRYKKGGGIMRDYHSTTIMAVRKSFELIT
jgi:hypothetical protein